MATVQAAMLTMVLGTAKALPFRGPFLKNDVYCSSSTSNPPAPEPTTQPMRAGSSLAMSRPACSTASIAAYTANWEKRAMRRDCFLEMRFSGSKSLTSQAISLWKPAGSNAAILAAPETPATLAFQKSSRPIPMLETTPMPVITTWLFIMIGFPSSGSSQGN